MTTIIPAPPSELLWHPGRSGLPAPGELGGKAASLARLLAAGCRVPEFFVLRTTAFAAAVGDAPLPATDAEAERRRAAVLALEAPDELRRALRSAVAALGGEGWLAVRSSAVGEDGGAASFAGQFDTVLGVRAAEDDVWNAVRRVWASAYSPHALAYLRGRGARTVAMAVVVQRQVEPAVSGVAFSVDPVTGDAGTAVVSAVYGLGEGLVSGALDADTYRVRFREEGAVSMDAEPAHKGHAVRTTAGGGTATLPVEAALRDAPALSDGEARRIAEAARALAAEQGVPQDVEWALAPGTDGPRTLWIVQARPVTAGGTRPRPLPGERRTWDNQNIVEPFPGITLPLSFSIGRHVMGEVFIAFAEAMGGDPDLIRASRDAFEGMLGLVRGRVYYDLRNYNRALSFVPGIVVRGGDIARVPLPDDPPGTPPPAPGALPPALLLAARVLSVPPRLQRETARLPGELERFRARAAEVLDPLADDDFGEATVDGLRAVYDRIDHGLLRHWHAPMLNDGLLDHWMMVLGQTIGAWLPGAPPTLMNDLLAGDGGMVSTEPVRRLAELAALARADRGAAALLAGGADDAEAWRRLTEEPGLAHLGGPLRDFVREYGDRCADEMKMEARTFAADPAFLAATLRAHVRAGDGAGIGSRGADRRAAAEETVRGRLAGGRQVPFFAVLEQVRCLMRERENTRFQRTRAMGILRRAFLALGARLAEAGALDDAGDVLYLAREEIFAYLDGTAPGALRPAAAARRAEFDAYAAMPELPERFVTTGPPALAAIEPHRAAPGPFAAASTGGALRGVACSAGVVRAPVRLVHDPRAAGDLAGRILVARQTDPGWTLLFAGAAGVLVQRGSMLSHAAIVAREMGIPCIVAIPGLMDRLGDGETVEMDGAAGTVHRIA